MLMIDEYQSKISKLEKERDGYKEKSQKMNKINEELRGLVDQERNAYSEEKIREQEEIKQTLQTYETKSKLIKNRLLIMVQTYGTSEDKSINLEALSNDDLLKKIQDIIQNMRDNGQHFQTDYYRDQSRDIGKSANRLNGTNIVC
jgi:hypothetical protein